MSKTYNGPLRPHPGDSDVGIPVTVNFNGGRAESNKTRIIWAFVSFFATLIVCTGIMLSAQAFLVKLFLTIAFFYLATLAIRFLLLKEHSYRKEMVEREENDLRIKAPDFWNIYNISENDYCYFRNGMVGMFVMLEKSPILGKDEQDKFNHYEAIADAYNIVASARGKLRVCHIDLMDFIGRDNRTRKALQKLMQYDNENMRYLLEAIFKNLQDIAENSVTTYDIYLFMSRNDEETFEVELQNVMGCLLHPDSNYSGYEVLNRKQLKTIAQALFNLNDFSITDATRQAFRRESGKARIIPIHIERDGKVVTKINKTVAEKRAEEKQAADLKKALERERRRQRAERKSKGKGAVEVSELEDLFSDIPALTADSVSSGDSIDPLADISEYVNDASTGAFFDEDEEDEFSSVPEKDFFSVLDTHSKPKQKAEEDLFNF